MNEKKNSGSLLTTTIYIKIFLCFEKTLICILICILILMGEFLLFN